jgi:hypothetical protein
MAKKITQAQKIRNYHEKNPTASIADISKSMGIRYQAVYAVLKVKDKPKKVVKFMGVTMAKDDVTKLTEEQTARLAHNLGRPRMRMQSSTNNPYWENKIQETPADNINHPEHYKAGGIETIDFIEAKGLNYHLGNVVKYISRADHKGDRKENLLKAQWYLNREIAKL